MLAPLSALLCTLALVAHPTGVGALPDVQKRAANASSIWVIDDVYKGANFFDAWNFWDRPDPTHGQVTYVNRETAMGKNKLAYVDDNGKVIMKVDNSSWLDQGAPRESVRISTKKLYTHGLFILDVERVPWGCGIWPAFWTNGYNWPGDGEIDIIEGVHDNINNQVAWHTLPGCYLTNPGNFTGTAGQTDCDANVNYNAGCAIRDPSRTSYGTGFRDFGGGVYATKWDENSIDVWFFYRATIPKDIRDGFPDPTQWGLPSASLSGSACAIDKYFMNHMVVFDTTICGDWAGSSYPSHCPGTCSEMVKDPTKFDNAYWVINSLIVYRRTGLAGRIASSVPKLHAGRFLTWTASIFTSFLLLSLEFLGVS